MRKLGLRMLGADRSLSRIPLSQSKNCHSAVALPKFDIMAARKICHLPLRIVIIHASQIEGRPDVPILHQVCTISSITVPAWNTRSQSRKAKESSYWVLRSTHGG